MPLSASITGWFELVTMKKMDEFLNFESTLTPSSSKMLTVRDL